MVVLLSSKYNINLCYILSYHYDYGSVNMVNAFVGQLWVVYMELLQLGRLH